MESQQSFGADQVRFVAFLKTLERIGVEWTIYNLGLILDQMGHGQLKC